MFGHGVSSSPLRKTSAATRRAMGHVRVGPLRRLALAVCGAAALAVSCQPLYGYTHSCLNAHGSRGRRDAHRSRHSYKASRGWSQRGPDGDRYANSDLSPRAVLGYSTEPLRFDGPPAERDPRRQPIGN